MKLQHVVRASEAARAGPMETAEAQRAVTAEQARACSIWSRLEREYALSGGRDAATGGGLLLPRHDRPTFEAFVRWMASSEERAKWMGQVEVALRTVRTLMPLADWCTGDEMLDLLRQCGGRAAEASSDA